jgi:hypothetical protein
MDTMKNTNGIKVRRVNNQTKGQMLPLPSRETRFAEYSKTVSSLSVVPNDEPLMFRPSPMLVLPQSNFCPE